MLTLYNLKASIGISKTSDTWTYAQLGAGIENFSEALNEVIQQYQFMSGEGFAESEVTGMAPAYTFSGRRVFGDAAQDYIFGNKYNLGADRKSSFKLAYSDGTGNVEITAPCTICNIVEFYGATTDNSAISFEIRLDGKPTVTTGA